METLGFSMYITMSSVKSDSFISTFQIWMPHISFSCLIAMAMASSILSPLHMHFHVANVRRYEHVFVCPVTWVSPRTWHTLSWYVHPLRVAVVWWEGAKACRLQRTAQKHDWEELPHFQGQERQLIQAKDQWLSFAGAAMKIYPMSKVRETQVKMVGVATGYEKANTLKP